MMIISNRMCKLIREGRERCSRLNNDDSIRVDGWIMKSRIDNKYIGITLSQNVSISLDILPLQTRW
jgi:hypothetical protein